MTEDLQALCEDIARRYQRYIYQGNKEKARNKLFELMFPYFLRWIKSILSEWKQGEDISVLKCMSWDAFLFCLDRWNPKGKQSLPAHCYRYTRYWMQNHYSDQRRDLLRRGKLAGHIEQAGKAMIDESITPGGNNGWDDSAVCKIVDLKTFRKCLPDAYQMIFDDALHSLHPHTWQRRTNAPKGVCHSEYYGAKRVMKCVVRFLLGEN